MDTYAIVLYFDEITTAKLNQAIKAVSDASNNSYMIDTKIPPHITIASFYSDDQEKITKATSDFASTVEKSEVLFEEIKKFVHRVLFVSPKRDKYLNDLNAKVNQILVSDFQPADNENYLPEKWVPHCALAVRLDAIQLQKAEKVAKEIQLPFSAKIEKMALAKCNPYQEICVWQIGNNQNMDWD